MKLLCKYFTSFEIMSLIFPALFKDSLLYHGPSCHSVFGKDPSRRQCSEAVHEYIEITFNYSKYIMNNAYSVKNMHTTERVPNPQTALGTGVVALGTVTSFEVLAGPRHCGGKLNGLRR